MSPQEAELGVAVKVSTILDHIDSGHMTLPEFQRGYVWHLDQVRGLMDSLYRGHPMGSLLVGATLSDDVTHRGLVGRIVNPVAVKQPVSA